MNPCQHLNWGCPTKQSTKAGGCASQKELEFEAESEQLCFIVLQRLDEPGPPPIVPRGNVLPLLAILSPDYPHPKEVAGDDNIPPGRRLSQEKNSFPAILRIPSVNLPHSVFELCPLCNGNFTLRNDVFHRLSKRFLPRAAKVLFASGAKLATYRRDSEVP
jgi:hypothetical protein